MDEGKDTPAGPATDEQAAPAVPGSRAPIVGVGASAGGLGEFQTLVRNIPADSGIAWVLIQHMAPDRESHLAEILAREASVPVVEVNEDTEIAANHVYVIAPGELLAMRGGMLRSIPDGELLSRRTSIDAFLITLAEDQGERCGCALLSGAGTDGTIGLKAVKEAGGLTLTQTLGSAQYDSMLLSAVRTGLVDHELDVENMPAAFTDFLVRRRPLAETKVGDGERGQICEVLRHALGHDFSGYKSSTLDRRIRRRMQMLGASSPSEYLEKLNEDRREPTELFRDLLIGVTQFFRDPEAFAALGQRALSDLLKDKTADDEIRVWVPGCASGEEAYSLAMLLHEQASGRESMPEIKVFGSDIDDAALHFARVGRYPASIEEDISPERLERYFEREDGTYCVRPRLRERCLFAQHNMLRDPPFSRIDLISCRNVLIYMNAELQKRLMPVLHYALRPGGFLFLGPAENVTQHPKLFREVDRKHRIFRRVGDASRLPEFPIAPGGGGRHAQKPPPGPAAADAEGRPRAKKAVEQVLRRHTPAYVLVGADYEIVEASAGTGRYLELPSGRPRTNLAAMAQSGLAVDVKAAVDRAMASGEPAVRTGLSVGKERDRRTFSLIVEPLERDGAGGELLCLVLFRDEPTVTERRVETRGKGGDDELIRALEQELLTSKERLHSTLEELETSNEELRTSNEEFSSVNEELQSSNEELETTKEELQSINEELRTVNNELSDRVEELSRANNDLKNLFANTRIAMLFLDEEFRIQNFTPPAKPLFRLRDHDLGRPLDELAGRMDFAALKEEVRTVIGDGKPFEREVQANGAGPAQTFIMRILPYRDEQERVRGAVLTFIDITERKRSEERLETLVSELNHRVKNSLATVQAMVRRTGEQASTLEAFIETIQGRLQAMAAGHNLLSERNWEQAGLRDLAEKLLLPFAEPGSGRLDVSGPAIELRPEVVVTLGMILHELATNAAKHGAWSSAGGRVALHWECVEDERGTAGTVRLHWTEKGGPETGEPTERGFGLDFVRQSTEYELQGACRPDFGSSGFSCTFELPADVLRRRPGTPGDT